MRTKELWMLNVGFEQRELASVKKVALVEDHYYTI